MKNTVKTHELPLQRGTVCLLCTAILISVFVITGCEEKVKYPINVPFIEYSLEGTSCQWANLNYDNQNQIIVIKSYAELQNYIECTDGNFPNVDFNKQTLLLAYGEEPYLVSQNYYTLQEISAENYVMTVNLLPFDASVITHWQVPVIVPKIPNNSAINLIITRTP